MALGALARHPGRPYAGPRARDRARIAARTTRRSRASSSRQLARLGRRGWPDRAWAWRAVSRQAVERDRAAGACRRSRSRSGPRRVPARGRAWIAISRPGGGPARAPRRCPLATPLDVRWVYGLGPVVAVGRRVRSGLSWSATGRRRPRGCSRAGWPPMLSLGVWAAAGALLGAATGEQLLTLRRYHVTSVPVGRMVLSGAMSDAARKDSHAGRSEASTHLDLRGRRAPALAGSVLRRRSTSFSAWPRPARTSQSSGPRTSSTTSRRSSRAPRRRVRRKRRSVVGIERLIDGRAEVIRGALTRSGHARADVFETLHLEGRLAPDRAGTASRRRATGNGELPRELLTALDPLDRDRAARTHRWPGPASDGRTVGDAAVQLRLRLRARTAHPRLLRERTSATSSRT